MLLSKPHMSVPVVGGYALRSGRGSARAAARASVGGERPPTKGVSKKQKRITVHLSCAYFLHPYLDLVLALAAEQTDLFFAVLVELVDYLRCLSNTIYHISALVPE